MKLLCFVTMLFMIGPVFSSPALEVIGTHKYHLVKTKGEVAPRFVRLLRVRLSATALKNLNSRAAVMLADDNAERVAFALPATVQLGMGNVPVLNQGDHGSCVTFAMTAAVDALLQQGDKLSQLCQLQLGHYLARNSYAKSGWDGSDGEVILQQMLSYGVVTKDSQQSHGCGGLTEYPLDDNIPETDMSAEDYKLLSVYLPIRWSVLLDDYQALNGEVNMNRILDEVKLSIDGGDRLTLGFFMVPPMGAARNVPIGQHVVSQDTWVMTPRINKRHHFDNPFDLHEVIITGYDDTATATDDHGLVHTGLLTVRNSWGPAEGNEGDFYMSYDYFKQLALDVQRIWDLGDMTLETSY